MTPLRAYRLQIPRTVAKLSTFQELTSLKKILVNDYPGILLRNLLIFEDIGFRLVVNLASIVIE